MIKFVLNKKIKACVYMFDIEKFKNSNIQVSVRFPEKIYKELKKISSDNNMSFNNVVISCIKYALEDTEK